MFRNVEKIVLLNVLEKINNLMELNMIMLLNINKNDRTFVMLLECYAFLYGLIKISLP